MKKPSVLPTWAQGSELCKGLALQSCCHQGPAGISTYCKPQLLESHDVGETLRSGLPI